MSHCICLHLSRIYVSLHLLNKISGCKYVDSFCIFSIQCIIYFMLQEKLIEIATHHFCCQILRLHPILKQSSFECPEDIRTKICNSASVKDVAWNAFFLLSTDTDVINELFPLICGLAIKMEEAKVQKSLKDAAKKGQKDVCTILAKEIIQSRRAVNKLHASKAQLNSVELGMKNQLGFSFILCLLKYSLLLCSAMRK